jgi:hypothetical protein
MSLDLRNRPYSRPLISPHPPNAFYDQAAASSVREYRLAGVKDGPATSDLAKIVRLTPWSSDVSVTAFRVPKAERIVNKSIDIFAGVYK